MEIIIAFIGGMLLSAVGIGIFETWIRILIRLANESTEYPWHDYNETPENKSYVLAYLDGKYVVLFYRDALFEFPPYYDCNWVKSTRVDRWMYIPGNTKSRKE